jgi:phospholipase/carboxylesterase
MSPPTRGAVLWMHGFGAGPDDFAGLGRAVGRPDLRWLHPAAPLRPIRLYGGERATAWYDLVAPFGQGERAHLPDVDATAAALLGLLHEHGVAVGDVVLGGFSQGAAMAMALLQRLPEPPAGLIALSGYAVGLPWSAGHGPGPTRALVSHGQSDAVVPFSAGRDAAAALAAQGHTVELHEHGGGHELHPRQIGAIRALLDGALPLV